jgi:catechol 2,3-dioxygenase-like lactoylglutathione lyase family enzyme
MSNRVMASQCADSLPGIYPVSGGFTLPRWPGSPRAASQPDPARPAHVIPLGGSGGTPATGQNVPMDFKLELIVIPVADVDRVKAFYIDNAGFLLDVDHSAGEDFRVVQLTPPGSACSITLMRNKEAAGAIQGLHLVVSDIEAARAELAGRGVHVSDVYHFGEGGQVPGPDPARASYNSFLSFNDPEGNGWLVQEVRQPNAGQEGS